MNARPIARVLLHAPLPQLDRLLDYAIPDALREDAQPGVRVRVPLRGQTRFVDGYIVELGTAQDPDRPLSEIDTVLSAIPLLPMSLYTLARRVADRAAGSASDILRLVIPRRQVRVEKAWLAAQQPEEDLSVRAVLVDEEQRESASSVLAAFPGLEEHLSRRERVVVDAPALPVTGPSGQTVGAWAELIAASAVSMLAQGRSSVIAVPDYRDLDQLESVLSSLISADDLVRDDARRTPAERSRAYLRLLERRPCIVVGNRSAVYAPANDIGLIAIWDDGDGLLEEPLAPYVHARDAALVRQELDECALLFIGHTRTTEVERLVGIGWVQHVPAARRYTPRILMSAQEDGGAGTARITSAAFRAARAALEEGGPVLVQVARPGFAPVLTCDACRRPARCRACGGAMRATHRGAVPECRWCGRHENDWSCIHCEGDRLRLASSGSTRTAEEFGRAFPGVRIILADGDHPVQRVDAEPALVVSTRGAEPIAEGGYRAVILLDGERMLLAESLRIGESCLRWWSNAAALAAPRAPVHLVGVVGAVARALATWTQAAYARTELVERAPLHLPPAVRVASLEGDATAIEHALSDLRVAVPSLRSEDILGPVLREEGTQSPSTQQFRALIRFEYGHGAAVSASLRASVIHAALRTRKPPRGAARGRGAPRITLKVRIDVSEPEL